MVVVRFETGVEFSADRVEDAFQFDDGRPKLAGFESRYGDFADAGRSRDLRSGHSHQVAGIADQEGAPASTVSPGRCHSESVARRRVFTVPGRLRARRGTQRSQPVTVAEVAGRLERSTNPVHLIGVHRTVLRPARFVGGQVQARPALQARRRSRVGSRCPGSGQAGRSRPLTPATLRILPMPPVPPRSLRSPTGRCEAVSRPGLPRHRERAGVVRSQFA